MLTYQQHIQQQITPVNLAAKSWLSNAQHTGFARQGCGAQSDEKRITMVHSARMTRS
jgi:hypothetical protein